MIDLTKLNKVAEIELVYKSKVRPSQRPSIKDSSTTYEILMKTWDEGKIELVEEFKVLLLNTNHKVLGIYEVSQGGITSVIADLKLIFAAALKASASRLILAHNHPSGGLKPSKNDIDLTSKIKQGGQFLDIILLDHMIVTKEGYYSFADEGVL